ncbi:MAG TPA: T9SS type A sorting domain-containing protein [Brumimicrobium sp.]|nr:T9SS type A sorting domain-containing protein [Brumimicrobium sp.]
MYNLEGRLIEVIDTNTNNSMVTINVSTFSHGVYLLRVNDKERSITKKFIKD